MNEDNSQILRCFDRKKKQKERERFLLSLLIATATLAALFYKLDFNFNSFQSNQIESSNLTAQRPAQSTAPEQTQADIEEPEPEADKPNVSSPSTPSYSNENYPATAPQANIAPNVGIVLQRQANGGFYVSGKLNNNPITYQIDTGASLTSIPREDALRAGVFACDPKQFDTANGQVSGCVAKGASISFGNITVTGADIAVMPNLKTALLGMNVLNNLRIENSGNVMRISIGQAVAYAPPTIQQPIIQQPVEPARQEVAPPAPIAAGDHEAICKTAYERDKENNNARMRQGYTAQEGEFLRQRLRDIEKNYRSCRTTS